MKSMGQRLKNAIIDSGSTMSEISKNTGIPNSTLSEIVNDKYKNLSIQKAISICETIGISLNYLIDGTETPPVVNSDETLKLITKKYNLLDDKYKIFVNEQINSLLKLQESPKTK